MHPYGRHGSHKSLVKIKVAIIKINAAENALRLSKLHHNADD